MGRELMFPCGRQKKSRRTRNSGCSYGRETIILCPNTKLKAYIEHPNELEEEKENFYKMATDENGFLFFEEDPHERSKADREEIPTLLEQVDAA